MIFDENNKAIYLQIVDRISDDIMRGVYGPESRLPSVREYAASVEVNTNTVMRSYDKLSQKGLIYNKRGIGFFVEPDAPEKIAAERTDDVLNRQLPPLFEILSLLKVTPDELKAEYVKYLNSIRK